MIKTISVMLNSIRAVTRFVEANAVTKAEVKVDITEEFTTLLGKPRGLTG